MESEQWDDGNNANGDGWNSMWIIESGFLWSGGSTTSKDMCYRCYFYQNVWLKAWPDKTFYDNTTKICSNWSSNWASWYGSSSNQCNTCNSGYILLNNTWVSNSLISSANIVSAVSYILVLLSLIVMLMKNCNLPPRPDESRSVYTVPSSNSQSFIPRISDYNYQFFWIIINTYQMLVLLLLLKADFHEAMIKLLSSFSFSTFNFEFIRIAFINNAQNSLNNPSNSSSWNFVSAMKNAGFRTGYLFVDYLYLLIFLVIFWIAHTVFRVFFKIHKDQTSTSNDLKHKFKELFEFRVYMRIFLWSFLFLMLEIFVQFGSNQNSSISMFSLILAIGILWLMMFLSIVTFIHFAKSRFKSSVSKAKLSVLYEGLKGKQLALAYSSIWLIQRFIIALDLAFIRVSFPQTIILTVIQLAFTMYIVFVKPFTNRVDNVIGIVWGGFTFLIYCMFLMIQESFNLRDDEIEQRTAAIIYLMLALSLIGLLLFLGYVVYEIIKFFKSRKMTQIVHHADIKIEVKSNIEELKAENPIMKYKERSQILDEVRIEEEKLWDISKLPPL